MLNKKIKAFTLAEMLVTLALTSVLVTFSYMGLSSMQKLLVDYKKQNQFITQMNELNNRITLLFSNAHTVTKTSEEKVIFKTDSLESNIIFSDSYILTIKNNVSDTFHFEPKKLKITNEEMADDVGLSLIKSLEFDIYFQKQKFHLTFSKNYDAFSKLNLLTDVEH